MQEVSALAFSGNCLIDVFHCFVKQPSERLAEDWWPRRHIHGIPQNVPQTFGVDNLLNEWRQWRDQFPTAVVYANGAQTESRLLQCAVEDWPLKPWAARGNDACHKAANMFKAEGWELMGTCCPSTNHSSFERYRPPMPIALRPRDTWPAGHLVKYAHGHHCSLYDCVELALDICLRKFGFAYMSLGTYDVKITNTDSGQFSVIG